MARRSVGGRRGHDSLQQAGAERSLRRYGRRSDQARSFGRAISPTTPFSRPMRGFVFGASCSGQRAVYKAGMTGIPIFNVNNNCSTGSSALYLARQAVESGMVECALAVGFEQMVPGAIPAVFTDRVSPFVDFDTACDAMVDVELPLALRYFGGAGRDHMRKYGTKFEDFAKVRAKASRHAANNPLAVFRKRDDGRRRAQIAGDLARRNDQADGLSADLRRCCGDPRVRGFREAAHLDPKCASPRRR